MPETSCSKIYQTKFLWLKLKKFCLCALFLLNIVPFENLCQGINAGDVIGHCVHKKCKHVQKNWLFTKRPYTKVGVDFFQRILLNIWLSWKFCDALIFLTFNPWYSMGCRGWVGVGKRWTPPPFRSSKNFLWPQNPQLNFIKLHRAPCFTRNILKVLCPSVWVKLTNSLFQRL